MDRLLGFDKQFLISLGIQLINSLILFAGLSRLLFKPVRAFMAARTERIKEQMDTAQSRYNEATSLKEEYETKLSNIQTEADEIMREARKKALEKEEQILQEAKAEAEAVRQRAMVDIEREQERAKDDLRKEMIEVASLMAGKFVASSMDESTQNQLLEQVIADLGDVKWLN